jgi:RNA polymerase sigma factor (sigma-70 family)
MTDEKIIELIRTGGSDAALNDLYKHFPMMRKMILSHGGSSDDAKDVFQEALIVLIRKIRKGDFQLTSKLSTYLFSVCRFLWKDEWKKRKIPVAYDFESGLADPAEQDLDKTLEEENLAKLAERALLDLKDRCRELLLLFYEGKWKLKEIAHTMGYNSENTAKNQKYKCLEAAKNRLRELKQAHLTF